MEPHLGRVAEACRCELLASGILEDSNCDSDANGRGGEWVMGRPLSCLRRWWISDQGPLGAVKEVMKYEREHGRGKAKEIGIR